MYQVHQKLNKYTGIYRCPDNINNFKIRVKLKEIPDITIATESELNEDWEIKEFKWQQKVFNNFEKQFYADEKNCVTDCEKQYNAILANAVNGPDDKKIFSYVENDNFLPEGGDADIENVKPKDDNNILEEVLENGTEFDYRIFLQQAIENIEISEEYSTMYIMADMGEYSEEHWVKYEHLLCILKYDKERKILKVYPDFSKNVPYLLQINLESTRNYYYFIEHVSEGISEELSQTENEVFKNISDYRKSLKRLNLNHQFELPPKNKLEIHIFFEIISGKNFEYNDIYVKYFVDLPEKWTCKTPSLLEGMTQTGHGKNEDNIVFFGHIFDLVLEYDIQDFFEVGFPKYPFVYFEIISRGSWDRYRCEGLCCHCLPIAKPGYYNLNLSCFRLSDGTSSELRRFFIGDCTNYDDITWIGLPKSPEKLNSFSCQSMEFHKNWEEAYICRVAKTPGNAVLMGERFKLKYSNLRIVNSETVINKYGVRTVGTGTLSIRMNILHQSQAFLTKYNEVDVIKSREKFIFEKLNSSSLVKSVQQVLEAFRKARKNMIEARDMT